MKKPGEISLIIIFLISAIMLFLSEKYSFISRERNDSASMTRASVLASEWFDIIGKEKKERGVLSPESLNLRYPGLIGLDYSEITTTLGSLDAKYTANNPEFAALTVRMLDDAGVDSNSTIGIISSGSFPSIAISTLAAVQILGARVVLISSLGSSSYGANDPGATWIDLEKWLTEKGGLKYKSSVVTYGAEDDAGIGIQEGGITLLDKAAARCGINVYKPRSFSESLNYKLNLLISNKIDMLINIGGNQVALGKCPHGSAIDNGMHKRIRTCNDSDRGLIFRLSEKGIPVIHFLNIKSLASEYSLPIAPSQVFRKPEKIYREQAHSKILAAVMLLIISGTFLIRKNWADLLHKRVKK